MKRISIILALMCTMLAVSTFKVAAEGESCDNPIRLTADYSASITKTGTVYYVAGTFDLPLTVTFKTTTPDQPPVVEMDFTCRPGVYEDSILCSLFCKKAGGGGVTFDMPYIPELKVTAEGGEYAYSIAMGESYRDLLLQVGIGYNVDVHVKVTYKSTGTITLTPDAFGNCMDGYKFMHAGDTIQVHADDVSRHVIVPYIQWMEDSIRYVWDGTAPIQVTDATECDFDPDDNSKSYVANFMYLAHNKDTVKLTSKRLKYCVNGGEFKSEAGMFFLKWHSAGEGILKIERVPQAPPRGGATLLRYNKATDVVPYDTLVKTYAIPYTWTDSIKFITPTDHIFKMYIGTDPDFLPKQAIASYQFLRGENGHWLGLYTSEMKALWKKTTEQYLYVKIWCTEKTTITPLIWYPSDCLVEKKTVYIPAKDTVISILRKDSETRIFRLHYAQWKNGDIKFKFSKTNTCQVFLADTCKITTNQSATNLLPDGVLNLSNKSQKTISAETVNSWEPYIKDEDGFIYMRLYCKETNGDVTITTTAPEEEDPAPIVYPAATVDVTCEEKEADGAQNVSVKVSKEQDIVIYDATSTKVAEWHQLPTDAPHSVKLQPGAYSLFGNGEKIAILIKN